MMLEWASVAHRTGAAGPTVRPGVGLALAGAQRAPHVCRGGGGGGNHFRYIIHGESMSTRELSISVGWHVLISLLLNTCIGLGVLLP